MDDRCASLDLLDSARYPAYHTAATSSLRRLIEAVGAVRGGASEDDMTIALAVWSLAHGLATLHNDGVLPDEDGRLPDFEGLSRRMGEMMADFVMASATAPRAAARRGGGGSRREGTRSLRRR